jgi:hypothetical protein
MDYYFALKYAHIIAFVYWLGGDLGTFFSSRQVVRSDIGVEARQVALKIMLACDQGPKLAMPAIFALGFQMAVSMQILLAPVWVTALVWLACLYWFCNVLVLYFNEGKPFTARLSQIDFGFRLVVIALLLLSAAHGLAGGSWLVADWVAWKMLVFAALVACGVMIRLNLKPFGPAFVSLVSEGPSEQANAVLEQSVDRCKPWVWAIWAGLFLNAAIGVHLL